MEQKEGDVQEAQVTRQTVHYTEFRFSTKKIINLTFQHEDDIIG